MVLDRKHSNKRLRYTRQLEENPFDRDSGSVPLMGLVLHVCGQRKWDKVGL